VFLLFLFESLQIELLIKNREMVKSIFVCIFLLLSRVLFLHRRLFTFL
jgi:hypothetical protein